MNHWVLLGLSIAAEIAGTTLLKYSNGFSKPLPTLGAVLAFCAAFYWISKVFQVLPVGIVYAVWSGVGIVATALIGWAVFNQKPDAAAVLGMAMIVGGVLVINLFSRAGH